MALIEINKETCTKCGLCAVPCRMIYFKEGSYPRQVPGTDEFCMRCGHCVGLCPTGALIDRWSAYRGLETQVEHHKTICVG